MKIKLFCKHKNLQFVENLHGDKINYFNGNRSRWICKDCGKEIFRPFLSTDYVKLNDVIEMLNNEIDRYTAKKLYYYGKEGNLPEKEFPQNEVFIVDDVYEKLEELKVTNNKGEWY